MTEPLDTQSIISGYIVLLFGLMAGTALLVLVWRGLCGVARRLADWSWDR